MYRPQTPHRAAFTLVELLVVIAILASLFGLTMAGVMKVYAVRDRAQTQYEIGELGKAIELFKLKYSMYPPSKVRLRKRLTDYNSATDPLDADSLAALQKLAPRLWSDPTMEIDWSGGTVPGFNNEVLEGAECLVFFLGGIPTTAGGANGGTGFAADAFNPAKLGGSVADGKRSKPYYYFEAGRLTKRPGKNFFSYLDVWGKKPYLYFSSPFGIKNRYDDSHAHEGVAPYYEVTNPTKRYLNAEKFQIVSAGANGVFNTNSLWKAAAPMTTPDGGDDHSNFHDAVLGAPR